MTIEWITSELASFIETCESESSVIPEDRQQTLRQVANWITSQLALRRPAQLVFICTHNSRRSHLSQIWAGVAAYRYGLGDVRTFSGGTEVTAMNGRVADSLRRSGLLVDVENAAESNPRFHVRFAPHQLPFVCFSKIHNESPNPVADYCAVMTCSHADEVCPIVAGCSLRAPVRYEDPKISDGTADEARVYDERSRQICREMLYLMSKVRVTQ